ncbi:MAG TPA: aminotransferase class IV [Clostridiaceae bacterium]|nr:aminotransferase class IV [Clostridiaceae bacterium]
MQDMTGKYYLIDDKEYNTTESKNIEDKKASAVYEVIRIIDGIPLFFEDHYERLVKSLEMMGSSLRISKSILKDRIQKLISLDEEKFCNIKITVYLEQEKLTTYMYISKSYYPSESEVKNGVKVDLFNIERPDPNIKKLNLNYRQQLDNFIRQNKLFEALLVNRRNEITEGSKSNVFFVKGREVYTAPDKDVLMGVTRKYILDACSGLNLVIRKIPVSVDMLLSMDGLFLSGTSIKVLPVSQVGNMVFSPADSPVINEIRKKFDAVIEENLASYRS